LRPRRSDSYWTIFPVKRSPPPHWLQVTLSRFATPHQRHFVGNVPLTTIALRDTGCVASGMGKIWSLSHLPYRFRSITLLQSDGGYVLLLNEAIRRYGSAPKAGCSALALGKLQLLLTIGAPGLPGMTWEPLRWNCRPRGHLRSNPPDGIFSSPQALGPGVRHLPFPERTAWVLFWLCGTPSLRPRPNGPAGDPSPIAAVIEPHALQCGALQDLHVATVFVCDREDYIGPA
jgi:hypothetical protein